MIPQAKRFWKDVTVENRAIRLDGRALRTPARAELVLPTDALAHAVAEEWRQVEGEIDPHTMPLTGLANAAIDRIAPDTAAFAAGLARYAEGDLLCYRASHPTELTARQGAMWDGPLDWARARYGVEFRVTAGIVHIAQPEETVKRLATAVSARDAFHLAGLSPLVTLSGSLVLALAIAEGAMTEHDGWEAAELDDLWQAEQWGEDVLATAAREDKRRDFRAAARFLGLLE
ncbi:ATP12 family chaperone protein [Sphingomonas oligoaromativorans]|uniref:ATP12 family chaperone protein n=1 Tax=Sphingomonas oligoaromativorans TaxID=575322 RepID=UPI00141F9CBA|nr:ATP12 family protein [Sphingomonas oligoaromativorans]NIJ34685.1 chaperone required for assembly of F1-ATPase [Sphingomonas oligoaromativorans]